MKFKQEYHYVPKELITNESIHSAVVYAIGKAGGAVSKGFGAYEWGHQDSKGLIVADNTTILWSRCFATEPVTLQQLFNHEDFKWPEDMDSIGYSEKGKVVFYGERGYSYIDCPVDYEHPEFVWMPLNLRPKDITLIATKECQEENINKEFTKDMLTAGKHVVELRNGTRMGLVELLGEIVGFNLQNQINNQGLHQNWYKNLSDDLTYPNDDYTVVKVYIPKGVYVYYYCEDKNLALIWERKEKSQQEIEYEGLMLKISELQNQAEKLKP